MVISRRFEKGDCTTMHRRILRALSPTFRRNEGSYSHNLASADLFFLSIKKIMKKWTIFEAVSSIQETVTRTLKAIREEEFYRAFDLLYEWCRHRAEAGRDYTE
jgi:hypothetical protein